MPVPPVLEEIARARTPIRDEVLKRWQQTLRTEIIPAYLAADEPAKPTKRQAVA